MKKIILLILIMILIIIPKSIGSENNNFDLLSYNINISTENNRYYVEEDISLKSSLNDNYNEVVFWISDYADQVKFLYKDNEINSITLADNNYSINLSSFNISDDSIINIKIKYYYDITINEFRKYSNYNISYLDLTFDKDVLFIGYNLSYKSNIIIPIYKLTEAPINIYIFASIFLIILFVLLTAYYLFRKQKDTQIKNISGESKELLSTKKLLLMSILKQLEKEYRAKKISDDTYNKLRDFYKKEAVESMKKLEDIESEII
jgi:hypothetical protein